ncbi:MAG TPA: hypothetical protein VFV53_02265 [Candidatus Limnocylindrales bacterium]|nr:hypothetical protein [Candidatus Limnocylindrales bacterium]
MTFFRAFAAIVLAILLVGLGAAIFQTGYLAGVAADGSAPVVVGPGYGYGWGGWGWRGGLIGGIVGFFVFLFVIFLFIGLLRAAFGGWGRGGSGRGGWGPGYGHGSGQRFGPWEQRAREAHDEWHRSRPSGGPGESGGVGGSGATGPWGATNPGPNDPPSGGAA